MHYFKAFIAFALTILASVSNATTFSYTYTFNNGDLVSGTFDGTASGDMVTDLSHVRGFWNGIALNGGNDLFHGGFSQPTLDRLPGAAVVSFDPYQNSFWFSDSPAGGINPLVNSSFYSTSASVFFISQVSNDQSTTFDLFINQWTLTAVPSVPEPETYAMLLAGLGVMGAVARRRKAQSA